MTSTDFHACIWKTLEPLASDAFALLAAPAPTPQAVAAVEAAAGFALPPGLAAFYQRNNGLSVTARDEVWPPAQAFAVGPAWTFWRGVVLLGVDTPDLPEWASIAAHQTMLAQAGLDGILPVLKVIGDGGRLWGVDASGTVVQIDDLAECTRLPGDITDVYAEQIAELVQRQQAMAEQVAAREAGRPRKLPG